MRAIVAVAGALALVAGGAAAAAQADVDAAATQSEYAVCNGRATFAYMQIRYVSGPGTAITRLAQVIPARSAPG